MISRCFLRAGCVLFAICCLLTVATVADSSASSSSSSSFDVRSPLYQHLPDCRDGKNIEWITKQTEEKGLVCPMFRDEEGFLAEFVVGIALVIWVCVYLCVGKLQGFMIASLFSINHHYYHRIIYLMVVRLIIRCMASTIFFYLITGRLIPAIKSCSLGLSRGM